MTNTRLRMLSCCTSPRYSMGFTLVAYITSRLLKVLPMPLKPTNAIPISINISSTNALVKRIPIFMLLRNCMMVESLLGWL